MESGKTFSLWMTGGLCQRGDHPRYSTPEMFLLRDGRRGGNIDFSHSRCCTSNALLYVLGRGDDDTYPIRIIVFIVGGVFSCPSDGFNPLYILVSHVIESHQLQLTMTMRP